MNETIEPTEWDNTYFNGKVRSINSIINGKPATKGEIDPGSYTFPTGSREKLKTTEGTLYITIPGETEERTLNKGEDVTIPGDSEFKIRVEGETAKYECIYLDKELTEVDDEISAAGDKITGTLN